jgi:cellulose synthase/poly-beta-1,6-N-acetylglucosamine synthase-like glycosyltransferase
MTGNRKEQISVCICTYHRNAMLTRLLKALTLQEGAHLFELSVIVVDNDAAGPARDLVTTLAQELGLRIVYEVEPVRTIPAARNRALQFAAGDFIAMIDDDEFPPADWLLTLYRAIQTFDVDGAFGPVRPFFETQPPTWLMQRQFSGAPPLPTGTLLRWQQTYTGNVLLKRSVLTQYGLAFDERYATGGEDQALFRSAIAVGCRFVAVEDAPVYETVPPTRWTWRYYAKRALVNGFNAHRSAASQQFGLSRLILPLRSCVAVCVYLFLLPIAVVRGTGTLVSLLERAGHHLSRLFATVGVQLIKERDF